MVKERKSLSRRNFITKTFSGMASLGFFGLRDKNEAVKESYESELNSKDSVIYRSLGKTGIQVPVVSMGVIQQPRMEGGEVSK
jgi:hypothetical protein